MLGYGNIRPSQRATGGFCKVPLLQSPGCSVGSALSSEATPVERALDRGPDRDFEIRWRADAVTNDCAALNRYRHALDTLFRCYHCSCKTRSSMQSPLSPRSSQEVWSVPYSTLHLPPSCRATHQKGSRYFRPSSVSVGHNSIAVPDAALRVEHRQHHFRHAP